MQLTIYHQLIGSPCKMLGKQGVIVDIIFMNKVPYAMIHSKFEKAEPSPFHKGGWVFTIITPITNSL